MDISIIGEEIYTLRKSVGMSQKELSEGICTQAQISKIEKGMVYPYATTLYLIAKKLGVDLNYFFYKASSQKIEYIQEIERLLKENRRSMKYSRIREIITDEKSNPLLINNINNQQLIEWHKGICLYHLDNKPLEALNLLNKAIELTNNHFKVYTEREIEIINSKCVIYFETNQYEIMLSEYESIIKQLNKTKYLNDVTIKTRVLYNAAKACTRIGQYEKSNQICKEAIDWCIHTDNMYLFAELHYHYGYNLELMKDFIKSYELLEKANQMFRLQKNTQFLDLIEIKLKELSYYQSELNGRN